MLEVIILSFWATLLVALFPRFAWGCVQLIFTGYFIALVMMFR